LSIPGLTFAYKLH